MPTTNVFEFSKLRLRSALEFWDRATIARVVVGQGSACLAGLTPDVSMGVSFDRQRRCQTMVCDCQSASWDYNTRARCGLRGSPCWRGFKFRATSVERWSNQQSQCDSLVDSMPRSGK